MTEDRQYRLHANRSDLSAGRSASSTTMQLSLFLLLDRDPTARASGDSPIADGLQIAERAEALGFHGVWVAEHHFRDFGGMPNPAVFLAAVAARTSRLRLGPAVSVLPFRDPLQVAEDYALVDRISNGRLRMGIGSGALDFEFEGFGLDPAGKRRRFEAAAERLDEIWRAGERTINVATVQQPTPPIYLATDRVDGAADAGGRGWGLLTSASPELLELDELRPRFEAHRRAIADSGHAANGQAAAMLFTHVADDVGQARREAAAPLARFFASHGAEELARSDPFELLRHRGTALLGTPAEMSATLRRLHAMGAREAILWMGFGGMPQADRLRSMERIASLFTARGEL